MLASFWVPVCKMVAAHTHCTLPSRQEHTPTVHYIAHNSTHPLYIT